MVAIFCQSARAGNAVVEIKAVRAAIVIRIMASPPQVVGAGLRIADEIIGRKLGGSNGLRFVPGTVEHTSGHVDAIIGTTKTCRCERFQQPDTHLPLCRIPWCAR